jgi:hypothetical protein
MTRRLVRLRARPGEEGFALIGVTLGTLALLTLAVATVAYGVGSQNISRRDQDWNGALSAAEAGIDDYIFRLNANGNYWAYSVSNPPPDGNGAFAAWVAVPGATNISKFRYSADTSTLSVDGTIKLTASGAVGKARRTVMATLRRRSFIDYLYFTDYETLDPALYPNGSSNQTSAWAQANCSKHWYEGRPEGGNQCVPITFFDRDTINGPLHTNDSLLICGAPHFNGATSSSWNTNGQRWRDGCPTSTPVFANAGDPKLLSPLTVPPSNSSLKTETAPLNNGQGGGCLYTGPTKITLLSNGQMTVDSKFSKQTNNGCPTAGTGSKPVNGVIYVQNVPSTNSDPNFTSGCPFNVNGKNHPLGLPITNDITTYGCRNGDVFVQGTLKGQLTIASENDVDVQGNITYNGGLGGSDLLGLIANNQVAIYHPVDNAGNNLAGSLNNPNISAAILSVQHSFRVQNWAAGAPLGNLSINGAIAQKYRGPVGTFSGNTSVSGYNKVYTYDQRLKYLEPPKFLDPVSSQWGVATWAEIINPAGIG